MKRLHPSRRKMSVTTRRRSERGIALATTLLLVTLLSAMSLAMVLSVSSDMLINGYYGNERGSFYAADSGATIARQAIISGVLAAVPGTFSATMQPIPSGTNSNVQTSILSTYGTSTPIVGAAGSWPEKFTITSATVGTPTCTVLGGPATVNGSAIRD